MLTVQDLIQAEEFKSLKLLAGAAGLHREIERIGILDYEFTREGLSPNDSWENEFVLTSFLYASSNNDNILTAIKRLIKTKAAGLAIRNVFRLEISQDVIRYANQYRFPIFIIGDRELFFEDIVIIHNRMQNRANDRTYQERLLSRILYEKPEWKTVKQLALEINHHFDSSYYVCFLKPAQEVDRAALRHRLLQGLSTQLERAGNALIRYKDGAFFIHSIDQCKREEAINEQWYMQLSLNPERFYAGISDTKVVLSSIRDALLESYYACYYAELYQQQQGMFCELGIYQVLFHSLNGHWLEEYLNRIIEPIMEYDNNGEFFDTLLCFEKHNGNYKETAQDSFIHENTIRYRIKKICELFNKSTNDMSFQTELLIAVKLYRMQTLIHENQGLFTDA